MNIGARILKTGLSASLAILIVSLLNLEPLVVAAIAAVIAIQPSVMRSWKYIKDVFVGNVIGAIFATISFYIFGTEPLYIGLIIILTIGVNLKLGFNKSINLSVLTVIAILTSDIETSTIVTALHRFSLVGIGVLSSFLVNIFILPPKHDKRLYETIKGTHTKITILLRVLPEKEITINTYKKEIKEVDKKIRKAKEIFELLDEEKKRFFVINRRFFISRIVVFRQMIKLLEKEKNLLKKIVKFQVKNSKLLEEEFKDVKENLDLLIRYKENIFLTYDGTLSFCGYEDEEIKIGDRLKTITKNLFLKQKDNENDLCWELLPVINALIDIELEYKKLETLVVSNRKKKEKQKEQKKIKAVLDGFSLIKK